MSMAAPSLRALIFKVPDRPSAAPSKFAVPWKIRDLEPLTELYGRFGHALWGILLLVALFRLPDFLSGVMASPLYRTLGFDLKIIGMTLVHGFAGSNAY